MANPSICYINSTNYYNVRIAWQRYINNHWQILSREYVNDSLSGIISITDSLADNINPSISLSIVAWIQNGNLIYKYFDSLKSDYPIYWTMQIVQIQMYISILALTRYCI